MGDFQSQQKVSRPQTKRARPTTSTRPPNWPISCKKSIILMLLTSKTIFNAILKVPHSFCQPQHFSRRFSLIAYSALPPPNSTRHCSAVVNFKMSHKQKSITSFFAPKAPLSSTSSSSDTGGNSANLPTETKSPIKKKELLDEKKPVHNSPLREPNRIQNESEVSLDSPIKKTKKQRKRIESSSEEEENGSPKQESPQKSKNVGTKRKSSPSLSGSKPSKKTKDEEETIEVSPKSPKSPETDSGKKKRRSQKEKDALPKKTSKSVKKEEEDNTEPMDVEKTDTEKKSTKVKLPGKKGKKKAEKEELVDELKALE